jgi:hypothetical protein
MQTGKIGERMIGDYQSARVYPGCESRTESEGDP